MTHDPIDDMKKFKQILNEHYSGITQSLPEALAAVAGDVIGVDEDDLGPVADDVVSEADMSAVKAIKPLYQQVQGLVPSFKDPIRSHLLQAQKSLLAAVEAAENVQVTNEDADNDRKEWRQRTLDKFDQSKNWFLGEFKTIKDAALAAVKGSSAQINFPNKARNDLWTFHEWTEAVYGHDYANQVWENYDLGSIRKAAAEYERKPSAETPEDFAHDVHSTMTMLIKLVQKMQKPTQ
jgi:hypothetical protein